MAKRGKMDSLWPSAGKCAAGGQARENAQPVTKRRKMANGTKFKKNADNQSLDCSISYFSEFYYGFLTFVGLSAGCT